MGLVVALIATTAALFLFFQANPQTLASPLDSLSSDLDAGKESPDVVEQPESANPAPASITISMTLDRTASIESYLRDAGMEAETRISGRRTFSASPRTDIFTAAIR